MAFGKENSSTGLYSIAIGNNSKSSGDYSFSMGENHGTSGGSKGYGSITMGSNCVANDDFSVGIGKDCDASGIGSLALGWECKANSYQDPSGWLPAGGGYTETSLAFGRNGNTNLFSAWRGGQFAGPKDETDENPVQFRKKNGGIIFAIGASGESYYPEILSGTYGATSSYSPQIYGPEESLVQDASYGNIFELYVLKVHIMAKI